MEYMKCDFNILSKLYEIIVHMSRLELLGANIKKYRKNKGLTQTALAVKLDLSYEFICKVENGKEYISLRKLFELADVLKVDFNKLTNFK